MKLTCLQENLSKGLNIVGRVVSTKSTLPVLNNILLKTEEGRLKLSATDLEIGINFWVGGKIDQKGEITIPARLFMDFINSLPNEKVLLETKDLTLNCKCKNYTSNIQGISSEEFPLIPEIKDSKIFSLNSKIFKKIISLVGFATALDESRPVLSGVLLNLKKKKLTLVATDSYRLTEKTIDLPIESKKDINIIIPGRSLSELNKVLTDSEGDVNVYLDENQILFEVDNLELTSRLIGGQFPNYKQIIPESYETKVEIPTKEFINVVRVASLFAKEGANNINININSKGKLEISAIASQVGDNNSYLDVSIEGKGGEITFNSKYLLDVLSNISSEKVYLEMSGRLNPGVIKPVDDKNYLYIIMPLRT